MTIERLSTSLADRYRIERELGQGGMATVYLAHDIKHDRKVAIKVVRPELAAVIGADRFVREIKTIANLQHPHILGLIDSGEVDGTAYYVMPFVEGESLRDRLNRETQLPIADAVRITTEVASALDYAHRHGVIHRDIKPENIMLHDGSALVTDFGIALAASSAGTRMTETGMSLGTPQYMSPEQAMGEREITAASDVYALGCVAYEMLTGEPPFSGATAQAIVARVVTEQPRPMTTQRHTIPANVEQAVFTALEKLPADRFATAGEFAAALGNRGYTSATVAHTMVAAPARARFRDPVFLGVAAIGVLALGGVAVLLRHRPAPAVVPPITFVLATTDSTRAIDNFPWPATISPDGGTVVYSVVPPGASGALNSNRLYFVRTNQLEARPIPGTEGASQPYFSPDGQWVGFETEGKEHKVRLDGSAPVTIADAGAQNGSDWTVNNEIILGEWGPFAGLSRVSAAGGIPGALTHVDSAHGERNHIWPLSTPDGKSVVFTIWYGGLASSQIGIASLGDGHVTPLGIKGIRALAVLDGYLVYINADGSIMAVALDAAAKKVRGSPIPVHDPVGVIKGLNGNSEIYVSRGGAMVTSTGGSKGRLAWISRNAAPTLIGTTVATFDAIQLSPDERRIAVVLDANGQSDVWVDDLSLGTFSRLTTSTTVNSVSWSPDSRDVIYFAAGEGGTTLWRQRAAGGVAAEKILELRYPAGGAVMAPNGKSIVLTVIPGDVWALQTVPIDSPSVEHDYLAGRADFHSAQFSPDGKWVALVSDESGEDEVYLRSFPDPSAKIQISVGGGEAPTWSADGARLYYLNGTALVAARLASSPVMTVLGRDTVMATFPSPAIGNQYQSAFYRPARDGQRFLTSVPAQNSYQLVVSPNWITEFRRKIAESRGGR
ncbi:MAG: protein kinase domain-containing protein [Gemmatimonadales bacterium]